MSLRLIDLSDRELLLKVRDECKINTEGWASSQDIADSLGLSDDRRNQSVGTRLGHMRRWGVIDQRKRKTDENKLVTEWQLNPLGTAFATGKLTQGQERAILNAGEGQQLLLARELARASNGANLVRREWQREFLLRR